jgi:hypothetical protein
MLRLTADENFNNDIVRGLRHRKPEIEIVRIQEEWEGQVRYLPLR